MASFHDSVLIYFKAVSEALLKGLPYKGVSFARSMYGTDFEADEGIGKYYYYH